MTRTLKFRAWDTIDKKWLFGYDYGNLGGFGLVGEVVLMGELNSVPLVRWQDIAIMQFTGKTDKNGKEIYDGDINPDGGKVIWVQDNASFCWEYPNGDIHEFAEEDDWCEVIGNIYENPITS